MRAAERVVIVVEWAQLFRQRFILGQLGQQLVVRTQ